MKNQYKIDAHHEYDRLDKPFGVYVRAPGMFSRWKILGSFKSDVEAKDYILKLVDLPHMISKVY